MDKASTSREEITRDPHTSIDVEGISTSMMKKIEKLPYLSPDCCIYRVPKPLREVNEKAYTPRVVSIGPLHHGKQGLEAMEEHKMRYLRDFLKNSQKPIGKFLEFIGEREKRIRECYAEAINFDSDKLVEIILVDAAFIIELFLRSCWFVERQSEDDRICRKPWMSGGVTDDLFLLENQIPFFVLEDLFSMADIRETETRSTVCTFMELARNFLAATTLHRTYIINRLEQEIDSLKVQHLVDLLRSCLAPRESISPQQRTSLSKFESISTATELNEAGVKFEASSSKNLFDLKFTRGVLKVPPIEIHDYTERYLRNLIAFEQCHYRVGYMSNYVFFMDCLMKTSKDVKLLLQSGVLHDLLADRQDMWKLFCNLSNHILVERDNFRFAQVCKELNDHCGNPRNKWMATLKQNYFETPWRVLSIVVAAILVVLTFIQTVCSILSVT